MKTKFQTQIRRANDNGKEWGYKKEYIMIDVTVDDDFTLHSMAEAADDDDISNARRRAIYATKKDMNLFMKG